MLLKIGLRVSLPENIANHILQNFQVNGAVPLTETRVQAMFDSWQQSFSNQILNLLQNGQNDGHQQQQGGNRVNGDTTHQTTAMNYEENDSEDDVYERSHPFELWTWGGRFHPVPQGFEFPSLNAATMWPLWHFGNLSKSIRPYKRIVKSDIVVEKQKTILAKTRVVMASIHARGKLPDGSSAANVRINSLPMSAAQIVFRTGYMNLMEEISLALGAERVSPYTQRRVGELKCTTIYKDIKALDR